MSQLNPNSPNSALGALPSHLSAEMSQIFSKPNEAFGEKEQSTFKDIEENIIKLGKECCELILNSNHGRDRYGMPLYWDTIQGISGAAEVFQIELLPMFSFSKQISITRYYKVNLERGITSMTLEDLSFDMAMRQKALSDEKTVEIASQVLSSERTSMRDRDEIPFRVNLTATTMREKLEITLSDKEKIYFFVERPQYFESFLWMPGLNNVSLSLPAQPLAAPVLNALEDSDWETVEFEPSRKSDNPNIEYCNDGAGRERVTYKRRPVAKDLDSLSNCFSAISYWKNLIKD